MYDLLSALSGVWTADIRKSTGLQTHVIQRGVRNLCENLNLIKPVKSILVKNRKMYILAHMEPAKEVRRRPSLLVPLHSDSTFHARRGSGLSVLRRADRWRVLLRQRGLQRTARRGNPGRGALRDLTFFPRAQNNIALAVGLCVFAKLLREKLSIFLKNARSSTFSNLVAYVRSSGKGRHRQTQVGSGKETQRLGAAAFLW